MDAYPNSTCSLLMDHPFHQKQRMMVPREGTCPWNRDKAQAVPKDQAVLSLHSTEQLGNLRSDSLSGLPTSSLTPNSSTAGLRFPKTVGPSL